MPARASSQPNAHHHDRDVVGRAPLHRLAGQPVAGRFVARVDGGLPFPALDLLILPDRQAAEWGALRRSPS